MTTTDNRTDVAVPTGESAFVPNLVDAHNPTAFATTASRWDSRLGDLFPVRANSKFGFPAGVTGREAPRTDINEHPEWANHVGNVGCRVAPDVMTIDVDSYGGSSNKHGDSSLADLKAHLGELPETVRTTSRGFANPSGQLWFRLPAGTILSGKLAADIDVIQHGHRYALVCPSTIDDTDSGRVRRYTAYLPDGTEKPNFSYDDIAELPAAWVEHLTSKATTYTSVRKAVPVVASSFQSDMEADDRPMCRETKRALEGAIKKFTKLEGSHHDAMLAGLHMVTRTCGRGHSGFSEAIFKLEEMWEDSDAGARGTEEFHRMLRSGVAKVATENNEVWTPLEGDVHECNNPLPSLLSRSVPVQAPVQAAPVTQTPASASDDVTADDASDNESINDYHQEVDSISDIYDDGIEDEIPDFDAEDPTDEPDFDDDLGDDVEEQPAGGGSNLPPTRSDIDFLDPSAPKIAASEFATHEFPRHPLFDEVIADNPDLIKDAMSTSEKGSVVQSYDNSARAMANDADLRHLAYNEMSNQIVWTKLPSWRDITSVDDVTHAITSSDTDQIFFRLRAYHGGRHDSLTAAACGEAMSLYARSRRFNPFLDHITRLPKWDGVDRLSTAIAGVAVESEYTRSVFRNWFLGLITRAFAPGSQIDSMLVLVGAQGLRKTSFFRSVADGIPGVNPYFEPDTVPSENKDLIAETHDVPVVIFDEFDQFSTKKDQKAAKSYITRRQDTWRAPYARTSETHSRHFVIAATTNKTEFLTDGTGARRYWPVMLADQVTEEELSRERMDLLLAEARDRFRAGERVDFGTEFEERANSVRGGFSEDLVRDVLDEWFDNPISVRESRTFNDGTHRPIPVDITSVSVGYILRHAPLSPSIASMKAAELNTAVREYMDGRDDYKPVSSARIFGYPNPQKRAWRLSVFVDGPTEHDPILQEIEENVAPIQAPRASLT